VLVQKEDDAKKLAAAVKSGKSFDELAKQLVAEKKATGGTSEAVAPDKLRPEIAGAVRQLKIGAVTEPQKLSSDGFVLVKLEAVRHPEDAAKRQAAVDRALAVEKGLVLRRYYEGLVKQYAKKDDKLLAALDFEAEKPGFDALAKDTRPIVQIQGAAPITVADLAAAIQKKFFHGIEQAAKSKKINREKDDLLSFILAERLFDLEAARAKIADSPEYKTTVTEYTNSLVFGTFVQKVIIPNVKVSEPEIKKYFEQHKSDYTYPAFYKLDGIGFTRAADAQAAVAKLNKGTDLGWIRSNAEGQLNPDDQTLHFGGTVVSKALPKDLLPILATTKKGDYRLYSSEGQHYVVQVVEYTAPSVQKYEEARSDVGQKAYDEKIGRAIEEYAAKLKKAYKPKILITKLGN